VDLDGVWPRPWYLAYPMAAWKIFLATAFQQVGVSGVAQRIRMAQVMGTLEAEVATPAPPWMVLGAAPVYPTDSNCNARGLTDLGDHAVRKLMQSRIIIDPDHLSVRARKSGASSRWSSAWSTRTSITVPTRRPVSAADRSRSSSAPARGDRWPTRIRASVTCSYSWR
jgi:hypothetical protein